MNDTVTGNKYYNSLKQMTSIQYIYPSVVPKRYGTILDIFILTSGTLFTKRPLTTASVNVSVKNFR